MEPGFKALRIDRKSGIPIYLQIERALRRQIKNMCCYERLPTEEDLIHMWGVSRGTIQKALAKLVEERLIIRVPSKGTFVAWQTPPRVRSLGISIHEELRRLGMRPSVKTLEHFEDSEMTDYAYDVLRVPSTIASAEYCIHVTRLVLGNLRPAAVVDAYIPTARLRVWKAPKENEPLHGWLGQQTGHRLEYAQERYEAVGAPEELAASLWLAPGAPVLFCERVTYLTDETPVMLSHLFIRTDVLPICVEAGWRRRSKSAPSGADGQTEERTNQQTDEPTNGRTDERING